EQLDRAVRLVEGDIAKGQVADDVVDAAFLGLLGDVFARPGGCSGKAVAAALQRVEFVRQYPLQRKWNSLLLPQQLHVPPPRAISPLRDFARLRLAVGHDDVPGQPQQREFDISLS